VYRIQFRAEMFNFVNHPTFDSQDICAADSHFGLAAGTRRADPAELAFKIHIYW
jgi:hypothetical protein